LFTVESIDKSQNLNSFEIGNITTKIDEDKMKNSKESKLNVRTCFSIVCEVLFCISNNSFVSFDYFEVIVAKKDAIGR
jgi:hypothetical protein